MHPPPTLHRTTISKYQEFHHHQESNEIWESYCDIIPLTYLFVIHFKDRSSTEKVEVEYPIGHRRRREQGIPLLIEKFKSNLSTQFSETRSKEILSLCEDQSVLENTSVTDFMALLTAE